MMKIFKLSIFTLLTAAIFSSCDFHCGEFPHKYKSWAPYQIGDVLTFSNGANRYSFEIDSVYLSKPYTEQYSLEGGCRSYYYLCSKKDRYPFIDISCTYTDIVFGVYCTIRFNENDSYNVFGFDYSLTKREYPGKAAILDTISYNTSKLRFDDVLVIKNSKSEEIEHSLQKIFIHNGGGLLGFIDVNGKEYKLVE